MKQREKEREREKKREMVWCGWKERGSIDVHQRVVHYASQLVIHRFSNFMLKTIVPYALKCVIMSFDMNVL